MSDPEKTKITLIVEQDNDKVVVEREYKGAYIDITQAAKAIDGLIVTIDVNGWWECPLALDTENNT